MAAPSYTTDLSTINLAETTTGWSAWGGGASGLSASPDLALEGTNCVDKQITAAEKGQFFDNGTGISPGANDHIFIWVFCGTPGLVDTKANRGIMACIGTSTAAYVKFHLTGSDVFDNSQVAKCWPIRYVNTGSTGVRTLVGSPGTNPSVFGAGLNITASVKGANLGVDGMRLGTGYYITAGDATTPGTFAGVASNDAASSYGVFQRIGGSYQLQGRFVVGQTTAGTPTAARFEDAGAAVFFTDTEHSLTDFTQFIVDHASTVLILDKVSFTALGTNNPGRFIVNSANPTVTLTGCAFTGMGITTLRSNSSLTRCSWSGCGQITANGASLLTASIEGYTGGTGTAALVWNVATDTDGKLDNASFTKGTGTTHAIELGSSTPSSITLRGWTVSGYNAADGQNDSVIYNNSGKAITVNVVGGSGTISVRNGAGASTTIVTNPVTTQVIVRDIVSGSLLQNARVYLIAADGTGPLPYQDSVTLVGSAGTVTVTHTAHGLSTGQKVYIEGTVVDQDSWRYLGSFTITVTGANTYTYTPTGGGDYSGSEPTSATSTGVLIEELTTASGIADDTRSLGSNQPVTGWVRKSSTSGSLYKTQPISGTVSSTNGLTINVGLIRDE